MLTALIRDIEQKKAELDRLRRGPVRVSGPQMKWALERAAEIADFGMGEVDVSVIPPRRLAELSRYGSTATMFRPEQPAKSTHNSVIGSGLLFNFLGGPYQKSFLRSYFARGERFLKSSAISSNVTNFVPSCFRMCSTSLSSIRSTCGRPETSG